jgi:hypothetical protein
MPAINARARPITAYSDIRQAEFVQSAAVDHKPAFYFARLMIGYRERVSPDNRGEYSTFDDRLQWDTKSHRHGLLEALVAGNPTSLDAVLEAIALESQIMSRQAIEHFEKPQSSIAFAAQKLAVIH